MEKRTRGIPAQWETSARQVRLCAPSTTAERFAGHGVDAAGDLRRVRRMGTLPSPSLPRRQSSRAPQAKEDAAARDRSGRHSALIVQQTTRARR